MNNVTLERTIGSHYPISIGTAVALECFFGVSDTTSVRNGATAAFRNYDCVVANLHTIARNYISSYKSKDVAFISIEQLYDGFVSEIVLINNIVAEQSNGNVLLSYYNHTYYKLKSHLKKANIKKVYTDKQQLLIDIENKLCDLAHVNRENLTKLIAYEYTNEYIKQGAYRNVIITHYPMDLLLTDLNVAILESHTGKIKPRHAFPTKLKRASEDVPFNKYTLQLLGDTSGYIMSMSSSIRKELLKICSESGISAVTQETRFIKTLKSNASSELLTAISGM